MNMDEYQMQAYNAIQYHTSVKEEVMHWAIGLGEEAGEVLGVIKHLYYGGKNQPEDIVEEIGDVLWHLAAMCSVLGLSLEEVAQVNLDKLSNRYPTGKFDEERSIARHEIDKNASWSERVYRMATSMRIKGES